jgi:hypothetical protein
MRQLGCMSADVYCQKLNNHFYATSTFLTERRGKGQGAWETERECVWETECGWKPELASVVKTVVGRRINYFESSENCSVRIVFSWETILMEKKDFKRYIKIKIMSQNAPRYLVAMTFCTFPIIDKIDSLHRIFSESKS